MFYPRIAPESFFTELEKLIALGLVRVNDTFAEDGNDNHMSLPKMTTDYRGALNYEVVAGRVKSFNLSIPIKGKAAKLLLPMYKQYSSLMHQDEGRFSMYFSRRYDKNEDKLYYSSVVCGYAYTNTHLINESLLKLTNMGEKCIRNYDYDEFNWNEEILKM